MPNEPDPGLSKGGPAAKSGLVLHQVFGGFLRSILSLRKILHTLKIYEVVDNSKCTMH